MFISIDLGRSTTRVASTRNLKEIDKITKFQTEDKLEVQKVAIKRSIDEVVGGEKVEGIALGIPGLVDKESCTFVKSANYPLLNGLDFSSILPESLRNVDKVADNDASFGALGEAYFGSGKGRSVVAYLTLSTGVGGARVSKKGKSYEIINAEPGHHIINEMDEVFDKSGLNGTLESFCSGPFFEKRYGVKPDKNAGLKSWKNYASHLSTGIINITAMWKPEIIVLGGGVSIHNFKSFYPFLIEELKSQSFFEIPEIKEAYLGDNAGVFGGFVLLKNSGFPKEKI